MAKDTLILLAKAVCSAGVLERSLEHRALSASALGDAEMQEVHGELILSKIRPRVLVLKSIYFLPGFIYQFHILAEKKSLLLNST